jgi:hypothetical protein
MLSLPRTARFPSAVGRASLRGMARRTAEPGDCFSSIAFEEGFFQDTLWNHPDNAGLRARRQSPNVLLPGDEVAIPALREKRVAVATGKRHTFRRKGVPAQIRIRLLEEGEPRAGLGYRLALDDGTVLTGQTAADGLLHRFLSPAVRKGTLHLDTGEEYQLAFGHLTPRSDDEGLRARLLNLQYLASASDLEEDELARALRAFQADHGLPETGEADDATRAKLASAHGS